MAFEWARTSSARRQRLKGLAKEDNPSAGGMGFSKETASSTIRRLRREHGIDDLKSEIAGMTGVDSPTSSSTESIRC